MVCFRYYYAMKHNLFVHPYGNHMTSMEMEMFADVLDEDIMDENQSGMDSLNPSSLMVWFVFVGMITGMAGMIAFMAGKGVDYL